MNSVTGSPGTGTRVLALPAQYEEDDLLDLSKSEDAAKYFASTGSTIRKQVVLRGLPLEGNEAILTVLIKYKLIDAEDLKEYGDRTSRGWLCECCARGIVKAIEKGEEEICDFWLTSGFFDEALELFAQYFSKKPLEVLLTRNKLSAKHLNIRYRTYISSDLLEILAIALLSNNNRIIETVKKSTIFKDCVTVAFQKEDVKLIKKLAEGQHITIEDLKQALSASTTLDQKLKAELGELCNWSNQNRKLIIFFLLAGVTYRPEDVLKTAQFGDYELLKAFQDAGTDISVPILRLIREGNVGSLGQLLGSINGSKPCLDPNLRNTERNTLLIEAVIHDQPSCVQRLLESGANPLIRNSQNQSVFDLLRGKSQETRRLLFNPQKNNPSFTVSKQLQTNPEMEGNALTQLLQRKAKGKPIAHYFGLFVRTHTTVIAILKSSPFNSVIPDSGPFPSLPNRNQIRCSTSFSQFPVPEEFRENITQMQTLAFAIIPAESTTPDEEVVKIETHRYTLIVLPSDYKSKNAEDQGFKYSHKEITTHGHGKNSQAAYSALKQHKDGIRLGNWPAAPDLSAEDEAFSESVKNLDAMFEREEENDGKLDELAEQINEFVQNADSIIHARYATNSNNNAKQEENEHIEEKHDSIKEELKNISHYSFNERRLEEWQIAIRAQIRCLQELERKLQGSKCIKRQDFEIEKKSMIDHLQGIRDIITEESVTSAEVPTIKIYTSSLLVKNIFNPSNEDIKALKKEICRLIGSSLHKIPLYENIATHHLEFSFRQCVLEQLQNEAQFMVDDDGQPMSRWMQVLAADLAILNDTSKILAAIPPVARNLGEDDPLLEATMEKYLSHYVSAREILDQFWKEICYDGSVGDQKLDQSLALLSQRFLLMDEEIRVMGDEVNLTGPQNYYYLPLCDGHPKRLLDEQLFLLQTSLVFALQGAPTTPITHSWIEKVIMGVQIRLIPSFHGIEKTKYNFDGLFLPHLVGVLRQIKSTAVVAYQSNPSGDSVFKPLHELLSAHEVPTKDNVEQLLRTFLQDLSKSSPIPPLPRSLLQLISFVQETYPMVQALKTSEQNLVATDVRKKVQKNLDDLKSVMDELKFAEGPKVSSLNVWAILNKEGDLTQHKERLKLEYAVQFKERLKENLLKLTSLIKSLQFDEATADQSKGAQVQFKACNDSIDQYLSSQSSSSNSQVDFSSSQSRFIEKITAIKSLFESSEMQAQTERCSQALEKITQASENDRMILEVIGLYKFLHTTKYPQNPNSLASLNAELHELVKPCLEECLHMLLRKLVSSIDDCQLLLHDSHVKKLQQISVNLRLGIREQVYYTTQNGNVSYFLWDGRPFDYAPYHTDNEVHIPLVPDRWSLTQRGRQHRRLLLAQDASEEKEKRHFTRIANKINDK